MNPYVKVGMVIKSIKAISSRAISVIIVIVSFLLGFSVISRGRGACIKYNEIQAQTLK